LLSCNQKKKKKKKGKGIKAMQQKWQQEMHGEQNKRIAAATINPERCCHLWQKCVVNKIKKRSWVCF